jgi:protein involved in polysaccharide export with SLBB domain
MRTKPDGAVEIMPVNVGAILNGKNGEKGDGKLLDGAEDPILKNHDRVIVYSNEDAKPQAMVQIHGEVQRQGKYRLRENMHLSDLIFRAGSLKNTAYMDTAEVARIEPDGTVKKVNVDLQAALKGDPRHDLILKENDGIFIRKRPDSEPKIVSISGEVKRPGSYSVSKDETFSQLLERAGGLTEKAYTEGMLFFRRKESVEQFQILARRPEVEAGKLKELEDLRSLDKGKKAQSEGEAGRQKGLESKRMPTPVPSKSLSQKSETVQFQTSEPSQPPIGKEKEPPLGKIIVEPEELEKPNLEASKTRKGRSQQQLGPQGEGEVDGKIAQDLEDRFDQRLDEIEDKLEGKLDDKIEKKFDQKFEERFLEMQKGQMELMELKDMGVEAETETERLSEKLPDVKETEDGIVRVTVDFKSLTDQKVGSKFPLKDGDRFFIPERPIMVLVQGEVSSPGGVMHKPGEGLKYYVEVAGGYTSEADKDKVYILRSNGRAVTSWLRFRNLGPGDTVIVPKKSARREFDLKGTIRDTAALLSGVLTVVILAQQLQK